MLRPFSNPLLRWILPCLLLAGCVPWGGPKPDLAAIYGRTARHDSPQRNPVIVIPGMTGSRLEDTATGRTVWGTFGGDWASGRRPDGQLLAALPMAYGVPFDELRDDVEAVGVLDHLEVRLFGLPIQLKAYFHILESLGVGGYRDEATAVDYGANHFTCFQFPYDWRRDNVENARRLEAFIEDKRAYVQGEIERRYGIADYDVRFDLVAHSMGAVLARYFLRYGGGDLATDGTLPEVTWAGSRYVERAVLVAPPNGGTVEAVRQLIEGKKFGPLVPRYRAAVLGTFPSGYQLLPRSRFGAVLEGDGPIADLFDPELWVARGWGLADPAEADVLAAILPAIEDPDERRRIALDHQRRSLERARAFTAALDRPARPPAALELYLITGDAVPTSRTVRVDSERRRVVDVAFGPGDGKVLRSSALMDEREGGRWSPTLVSPVQWEDTLFLFNSHLRITRDPSFTNNLLFWLLESPRRPLEGE
ncbi:MAG: hypothetical protein AAF604_11950 [Acidobacteriota bacterium]